MKKIFLSLAAIALSMSMAAITPTATAVITMTGDVSGSYDVLTLVESTTDGFTDGYENGYDVYQVLANIPSIYAVCGSGAYRFATSMTNSLTDNPIGIKTGTDTEYTMSFASVTGTIKLYDLVESKVVTLASGDEYHFTAAASSTIENRFVINKTIVGGNLETCFTGTELQIKNNPYFGKVIITNNSTSAVHEYEYAAETTINMSNEVEYPNGTYTVQVGSGANIRKFIVTIAR